MIINRKKTVIIWLIIICALLFILFWNFPFWKSPKPSDTVIDQRQVSNPKFSLSVTVRGEENGGYVPGAYYTFEVFSPKLNDRKEIFTFRHDDVIPINKESLNFVSEDIGFVYMGWMFALTKDGGINWTIWDGSKQDYLRENVNYNLINKISINRNGTGTMELNSKTGKQDKIILITSDFGMHWNVDLR